MPQLQHVVRFSDILNRVVVVLCVGFLLVMLGISFTGFFYTLVSGDSLSWTYSLARLFIPWIGLLSITVAFKRGEHIAMTSLLNVMPAPVMSVLRLVNRAVLLLFSLLLMWYGWEYFDNSTDYYMVSDQIQIRATWVTASLPVTGLIMFIHALTATHAVEAAPALGRAELEAAGKPKGID